MFGRISQNPTAGSGHFGSADTGEAGLGKFTAQSLYQGGTERITAVFSRGKKKDGRIYGTTPY
jgi:hypothetical protein